MAQFPSLSSASGIWSLKKQKRNQQAGNWPTIVGIDAQFNYVTMLLRGDGSMFGGDTVTPFNADASTNNFNVTINGDARSNNFTPYQGDGYYSNYFGSANYISASSNAAFALGTGDFTVEAWVYPDSAYTTYNYILGVAVTNGLVFYVTGGNLVVRAYNTGDLLSSSTIPALNTWTHIAATRSGTTLRIFVNGVQTATTTNSTNFAQAAAYVGNDSTNAAPWYGYISNFRLVKGTAVYTSNFTPSTTPLTAISGTSLLTCQSNRFIDNSSNAFTITVNGSPAVSPLQPFTLPSSVATYGSGYFDGSGDTLDVPTSANNSVGTGSFCFEAWIYMKNSSAQQFLVANASSGGLWIGFNIDTSNKFAIGRVGTAIDNEVSYTWTNNQWYHVAVNRNGTNLQFFVNGTQVGSTGTNSVNYPSQGYRVGSETTQKYFTGYMTDFRLVRASTYTTTFTPTTTPLTAISNTAILLSMTNAGILDNAMMNDLETVGNAQISTSVKKYGTGSMYFDGTGDYLIAPATPDNRINTTGNFTIEMWVYFNTVASDQRLIAWDNNSNNFVIAMYTSSSGNLAYYLSSNGSSWNIAQNVSMGSVANNTWYHVALVRNGSVFTPYINGVGGTTTTNSAALYSSTLPFAIGAVGNGASNFNGYIDDLRITKGVARYTANFSVPTSAFPNQ